MNPTSTHPLKALLEAWKRIWPTRRGNGKRACDAKLTRTQNPHHRHTAFLEFP